METKTGSNTQRNVEGAGTITSEGGPGETKVDMSKEGVTSSGTDDDQRGQSDNNSGAADGKNERTDAADTANSRNFDHIYSHVSIDPERRRSRESEQLNNSLFDSQLDLPDLNDLIESPLLPPIPREYNLMRSMSGVVFGCEGNTVQIEEDSTHSFDTEGDSRSFLLNDTLTEVSEMYASATTCPGSDNDFYTLPDDDMKIDPIYEEIPVLRSRKNRDRHDKPAARCSIISSDGTICSEENSVDCQLSPKLSEPDLTSDACARDEDKFCLPVPDSDIIYQKVNTFKNISHLSSVESKQRDDTMAFFKRSFARVRLDLLFRKKKNHKFVECVEKVIEARRSGCIDEDGNIIKNLDEQLKTHGKDKPIYKKKKHSFLTKHHHHGSDNDKRPEAEIKPQGRIMGVSNPNYRESYPLPEEDDGSEGYESASEIETVDSSGGNSSTSSSSSNSEQRTSPRLSGILSNRSSHHESEDNGEGDGKGNVVVRRSSSRRVRFSDEVQEFEHIHRELITKQENDHGGVRGGHAHRIVISSSPPSSESDDENSDEDADTSVLSLSKKINMFENISKLNAERAKLSPKLTRSSGHRHSDPGPTRDSMKPDPAEFATGVTENGDKKVNSITKARVEVFEKLSHMKPGERLPPKPKPRASLLEIRVNQTKQKIMFFEQLRSGQILPLPEED